MKAVGQSQWKYYIKLFQWDFCKALSLSKNINSLRLADQRWTLQMLCGGISGSKIRVKIKHGER